MKKAPLLLVATLSIAALALPAEAKKKKKPTTATEASTTQPVSDEAKRAVSDASIEKQAKGIAENEKLGLKDSDQIAKVQEVIATHLKEVRDWHNSHTPPDDIVLTIKGSPEVPSPKPSPAVQQAAEDEMIDPATHKAFVDGLNANLTPAQVETVKDLLTAGKVDFTFRGYQGILPNMTPTEQVEIMKDLKAAREDALDVKGMDEKSMVFKIYKNKIQAYLNAHGHNWDKEYKAYLQSLNAKKSKATSKPSEE